MGCDAFGAARNAFVGREGEIPASLRGVRAVLERGAAAFVISPPPPTQSWDHHRCAPPPRPAAPPPAGTALPLIAPPRRWIAHTARKNSRFLSAG